MQYCNIVTDVNKKVGRLFIVSLFVTSILLSACSSPMHPQSLGEYLEDLFVSNGIVLNEEEFFEPTTEPYLAFAKILCNIIC